MKSILLYHIYPINHWKQISDTLLARLPFEKVVVHVSLPQDNSAVKNEVIEYFSTKKIDQIIWSLNSGIGEVDGMRKFVTETDLNGYDCFTFMHCKGVTKPHEHDFIFDWTRLMHYFVVERRDLCKKAFRKGYWAYGCNKTVTDPHSDYSGFRGSSFHFSGNFVNVNLNKVTDFKNCVLSNLENDYHGVEGLWGKFIPVEKAYEVFNSGINHYYRTVAPKHYNNWLGRTRYVAMRTYYEIKRKLVSPSH